MSVAKRTDATTEAEAVIEIEELEAPGGVDLLSIGPAAPAEHAEHHQ